LLCHISRIKPLFGKQGVIGIVVVHPHCKYLTNILLTSNCMLAEEGE
jgi:hypothetical protein